ncbi:MAG: glutamate racemase, partial [Chloroflexota bacterium]
MKHPKQSAPIAVFDSGVGGLSVLNHLQKQLPHEHILYFADQANIPYGGHALSSIQQFCHEIVRFLLVEQVKMVVVACNTASAAALSQLRFDFPDVPFVGMEPAVKPAAKSTKTNVVGVMATAGTFSSERYASLMKRYGSDIEVIEDPCIGLVELIEAGHFENTAVIQKLRSITQPMLDARADTLVLGCTHYPFVQSLLTQIAGEHVTIIDPAPAVALQAKRVLKENHLLAQNGQQPRVRFISSGIDTNLN